MAININDPEIYDDEEEGLFHIYTDNGGTWKADIQVLNDDLAYIERIDVNEDCRGQGIGTQIIKALKAKYWRRIAAPDNADCAWLFDRLGEKVEDSTLCGIEIWPLDQGYGIYEVA